MAGGAVRVGSRVRMVDRYPARVVGGERSWFHGMRGVVTATTSRGVMVHLDDERLPMAFDPRDLVVDESSATSMTGAE